MKIEEKEYYNKSEVAKIIGVSRTTLDKMIDHGEISFKKFGRVYRLSRKDLERFMAVGK